MRPCFEKRVKEGYLAHNYRLALIREVYWFDDKKTVDEIVDVFRNMKDFDEKKSRYFVKYYLRKEVAKPTRCKILKKSNFCLKDECPMFKIQHCELCGLPFHWEYRPLNTLCPKCFKSILEEKETPEEEAIRKQVESEWEKLKND